MKARSPALVPGLVALLLIALLLQAVLSMRLLNASTDEQTHLPSGYSYVATGDLRLNPQHPPLVKLMSGLSLLAVEPQADWSDPAWTSDPPNEWDFGYRFLYETEGNDADLLLFWGRLPVVLTALLMALYVFRWARELFGNAAGVAALALCAFSPTVIAHARFVTFDVPLACFSTIALYHLWRYERDHEPRQRLLAGLGLGLAMATKFSGLILLPVFAVLIALPLVFSGSSEGGATDRSRRALVTLGIVFALALVVVQASYLFSADPWIYWKGALRVNADHDPRYAYYLMGEFSREGWWYYFPAAFLFKTPLPTLIILLLAVLLVRRLPSPRGTDELFLGLPIVAFGVATAALADNMGVRYLLPLYPLLFVSVSRLAPAALASRWAQIAAGVLGLWVVVGTVRIFPDHLAFFNELAGGPENGHRFLDDSNLDWGTDIKRLRAYLDREGIESVRLRYAPYEPYQTASYYGIAFQPIHNRDWFGTPRPGVYVVGTHKLIRGRLPAQQRGAKSDWLERYEPIGRVGYSLYVFRFDEPAPQ